MDFGRHRGVFDLISLIIESHRWLGRLNGREALFPSNYVELIPPVEPVAAYQGARNVDASGTTRTADDDDDDDDDDGDHTSSATTTATTTTTSTSSSTTSTTSATSELPLPPAKQTSNATTIDEERDERELLYLRACTTCIATVCHQRHQQR